MSNAEKGRKDDQSKARWDLLPVGPIKEVVEILTFGAIKYSPNNWQLVSNSRQRYYAATMRHLIAWWEGEVEDKESHKSHLAHAICCLIFLLWFDQEKEEV